MSNEINPLYSNLRGLSAGDVEKSRREHGENTLTPPKRTPLWKLYLDKYKDPIIKDMEERAKEVGGHGGMDFIMDSRLIYCLHNGLPLDMDVYDLAEWCSLIPLTKLSIENGSVPVEIPDFTRGAWNKIQGYRHAFAK